MFCRKYLITIDCKLIGVTCMRCQRQIKIIRFRVIKLTSEFGRFDDGDAKFNDNNDFPYSFGYLCASMNFRCFHIHDQRIINWVVWLDIAIWRWCISGDNRSNVQRELNWQSLTTVHCKATILKWYDVVVSTVQHYIAKEQIPFGRFIIYFLFKK